MPSSPLPKPPKPVSDVRPEHASLFDYILCPAFLLGFLIMDFTIVRLFIACFTVPIYVVLAFSRSVLPYALSNLPLCTSTEGRRELARRGEANRNAREEQGRKQFEGTFEFRTENVERGAESRMVVERVKGVWSVKREFFDVCGGVKAAVVREGPRDGKKAVLLHGNPSWSFMYRNVRRFRFIRHLWVD